LPSLNAIYPLIQPAGTIPAEGNEMADDSGYWPPFPTAQTRTLRPFAPTFTFFSQESHALGTMT